MNKPFAIVISFSLLLASGSLSFGQVISPKTERVSLLDNMEAVVENVNSESRDYSDARSPFHEALEKEEVVKAKNAEDQVSAEPVVLSDAEALRAIGQRFRPLGSLVFGERGILQLSNGKTIEEGETFNAEIQGTTYPVLIEEVTQKMYRLRLGNETLEKSMIKTPGL